MARNRAEVHLDLVEKSNDNDQEKYCGKHPKKTRSNRRAIPR